MFTNNETAIGFDFLYLSVINGNYHRFDKLEDINEECVCKECIYKDCIIVLLFIYE